MYAGCTPHEPRCWSSTLQRPAQSRPNKNKCNPCVQMFFHKKSEHLLFEIFAAERPFLTACFHKTERHFELPKGPQQTRNTSSFVLVKKLSPKMERKMKHFPICLQLFYTSVHIRLRCSNSCSASKPKELRKIQMKMCLVQTKTSFISVLFSSQFEISSVLWCSLTCRKQQR